MSQTIENRIVEMQFENKQFESGVQESLSTLDKLKNALKFGVYKKVDEPNLSMALGSGDTTLLGLTSAFAKIINGGKNIDTYIIDRVQDRNGKTVYKNDNRECENCSNIEWIENSLLDI